MTMTSTNELSNCYGCVKEAKLTDYYDYVTNLLCSCYDIAGIDTVKPRLHYGVNGILRLCNDCATVSTVMTAKRIYFTPAEQLSVIKRQLVVKLMEEEKDLLLTAAYLQLQIIKKTRRKRKKRSVWMRDWLQCRVLYGQYEKLVAELREEDARGYKNTRISPEFFQELLERVAFSLEKGTLYEESLAAWASSCHSPYSTWLLEILTKAFRTAFQLSTTLSAMLCQRPVRLRSTTEEMKFLNMLKIAPRINQDG